MDFVSAESASGGSGSPNDAITQDGRVFQAFDDPNAYFQVEFKDSYVFATHYSFKGWDAGSYSKEWDIYGFNSPSETPQKITTNTSIGSTYCESADIICNAKTWGTFAIQNPKKAYRYIKITIKTPSDTDNPSILLSGFDIFGVYSKDGRTSSKKPKRTYCFKSYPISRHFPVSTLMKMIFICS